MRLSLLFACILGMIAALACGNAEAQRRLPRSHFRVVVDEVRDDYRVRVGRGVGVRQLLTFANRHLPAGQPPVTRDDFIAENQLHGDSLDGDGTGNLVYVCGHTAHRRRTYSRSPGHWATCPDARHYIKLVAHHEWYWVPRRHRPGLIENLDASVRTAIAQSPQIPIQWRQMSEWVRRWLEIASPTYQPGYHALVATHDAMVRAAGQVQEPTILPPTDPSPVVTPPAPVREPPSPPSDDGTWTFTQIVILLVLIVLAFVLGILHRQPKIRAMHQDVSRVRASYNSIVEGFNGVFIRPGKASEPKPEDIVAAVAWSRRVLTAYALHCAPFEDPEATDVMDGVRIDRAILALEHRAALLRLADRYGVNLEPESFELFLRARERLIGLAHEYGVTLTPETFKGLLEHAQYEVYDPNVIDQRDVDLRAFRAATQTLLGEEHDTADHLRAYAIQQRPDSPRDPLREKTPLMSPLLYPGDHVKALQNQVDALEAALARQTDSIPPGVRAAAVLATRVLPLMRMVSEEIDTTGRDVIEEARRIHEQGGRVYSENYVSFADAVRSYAAAVGNLMRLDERVLKLLEEADKVALEKFARDARSQPPPMLAALMDEIMKSRGQTPPPKLMPQMPGSSSERTPTGVSPGASDWGELLRDGNGSEAFSDADLPVVVPPPPGVPSEMKGVIGTGQRAGARVSRMPPEEPFAHTESFPRIDFPPGYKPPGTITLHPPPNVRPTLEPDAPPDGSKKKTT